MSHTQWIANTSNTHAKQPQPKADLCHVLQLVVKEKEVRACAAAAAAAAAAAVACIQSRQSSSSTNQISCCRERAAAKQRNPSCKKESSYTHAPANIPFLIAVITTTAITHAAFMHDEKYCRRIYKSRI